MFYMTIRQEGRWNRRSNRNPLHKMVHIKAERKGAQGLCQNF